VQKLIISFLSCILILVSTSSFARDKQPRRFNADEEIETTSQTSSAPITTKQNMSADERLQRLERLIDSQGLVDLLLKLQGLEKEVQQLRGDVEIQTHTANELKKRQRDLYVDIDRRLLQIERNGSSTSKGNTYSSGSAVSESLVPSHSITNVPSTSATAIEPKFKETTPSSQTKPITAGATGSASKPVDPIKEQNAYQKAFDLLRELRYEQAIIAYRQFIQDYPNGRYAHIAQYWLSEASYAQRHFKQAIADYQDLVANYPNSPKLAEAMLKIGYSYNELGQNKAAQDVIEKLLRVYPNTTAAGQGQKLLKKIKSAKR